MAMVSSTPPPGGDVSRAYVVAVPTVLTVIIAAILTALRLYVRTRMLKRLEWDDFFNVLAMVALFVVMGLVLGSISNGLGRHFHYLDKARASYSVELLRICEFFLILSTILIKISISLFLKRLFLTSRRWKQFLWSFIAFNTITSLLDAAIIFPQCSPIELNWDHSVEGHCWSNTAINATGIVQGVIAALTDVILATLPIVFLWNIRIERKAKLGICGVMALGFASGGFAVARTVLVPSLTITQDPTWDLVDLFLWAVLEATIGAIAAAAPSVRPLFGHSTISAGYARYSPGSAPLQPSRKTHTSCRSWYHEADPELHGFQTLKGSIRASSDEAAERISDGESSEIKLWPDPSRRIVKTTNVSMVHSHHVSRDAVTPVIPDEPLPDLDGAYDTTEMQPSKAIHM